MIQYTVDAFVYTSACMLHEPTYDFNDDMIPLGATLFTRLVEQQLLAR